MSVSQGYQELLSVLQDSYTLTMDHSNQDQDKLGWPPAKASNVKQSKSVTFKDC